MCSTMSMHWYIDYTVLPGMYGLNKKSIMNNLTVFPIFIAAF